MSANTAPCATVLFRDFVWAPCSPSMKGPVTIGTDVTVAPGPDAYVCRLNRLVRSRLVARTRFKDDHHGTCMFIERSKNENVVVYQANLVDAKTGAALETGANAPDCAFKPTDPLHAYWIKLNAEHVARRRARGETEDLCELNMLERKLAYGCSATLLSKEKFVAEVLPDKASRAAASPEEVEAIELLHATMQPCACRFVALSSWHVYMLRLPPLTPAQAGGATPVAADTDSDATNSPPRHGGVATARAARADEAAELDTGAFPSTDTIVAMIAMVDGELSVIQKVYVSSVEPKHFYQLPRVEYIEVHGTSLATGEPTYEKRNN